MSVLQKISDWMTPKMPLLIIAVLAIGLLFPDTMGKLCPYITVLMCAQTFFSSLGDSFHDLIRMFAHPKPILLCLLTVHILMPLIAFGVGTWVFPEQPLYALGFVLIEASPVAIASLMWVSLGSGNVELCLSVVLFDTLLSPLILPLTLRVLCGSVVALDTVGMIRDLVIMTVLPAAAAMLLCRFKGKPFCARIKSKSGFLTKLIMLIVVGANITRSVPMLQQINGELLLLMFLTFLFRPLGLLIGYGLSRLFRFPRDITLTVTVDSGTKNIAAASTIAAQYFPTAAAFAPSISPMFSQFCTSIAVQLFQRSRAKANSK